MEVVTCNWEFLIKHNKVLVIGTAPLSKSMVNPYIERAMIAKVVEFIDCAKKLYECHIISQKSEYSRPVSDNSIIVSFSIMFSGTIEANEYVRKLKS